MAETGLEPGVLNGPQAQASDSALSAFRAHRHGQVTAFHPDGASLFAVGLVFTAGGLTQPAAGRIAAVFVLKYPFEHQDFLPAGVAVVRDPRAWRQPSEVHVLAAPVVQGQQCQSSHGAGMPGAFLAIDHHVLLIRRMHLPQLDEQRATFVAGRSMG